jgi:hypothetical protein
MFQSILVASLGIFSAGLVCGGLAYEALNGAKADKPASYSSQDRRDIASVVRAINHEAKRKAGR